MAGLYPAGVLCEILNDDGSMARVPELMEVRCQNTNSKLLPSLTSSHTAVRRRRSSAASQPPIYRLHTGNSNFTPTKAQIQTGENVETDKTHIALTKGDIADAAPILVRVHSQCLTGDVFGSLRCDCGEQLEIALQTIEKEGRGVLLYMRQEGRGMGLKGKLRAYQATRQ